MTCSKEYYIYLYLQKWIFTVNLKSQTQRVNLIKLKRAENVWKRNKLLLHKRSV